MHEKHKYSSLVCTSRKHGFSLDIHFHNCTFRLLHQRDKRIHELTINKRTYRLSLLVLIHSLVGSIGEDDIRAQFRDNEMAGSIHKINSVHNK